ELLQRGGHQIGLALEVMLQRPDGDAGAPGDVPRGGVRVSPLDQTLDRRVEDLGPRRGPPLRLGPALAHRRRRYMPVVWDVERQARVRHQAYAPTFVAMLHLHRSTRADGLVDALGTLLAEPPDDPFAPEVISVPTRGMERWI